MKFLLLQTLRLASQATSLYTREAHYRPTVHLKGVTHYTLQGKACEKEYEQMPVLLLFFRQVKPALWKAPLLRCFFARRMKKPTFLRYDRNIRFGWGGIHSNYTKSNRLPTGAPIRNGTGICLKAIWRCLSSVGKPPSTTHAMRTRIARCATDSPLLHQKQQAPVGSLLLLEQMTGIEPA